MLNKFQIIGRLTKDLEIKQNFNKNQSRVHFTLATETYNVDFPNIVAFGKTAEDLAKYNGKGDLIFVEGYINTSVREKEGEKHHYQSLVATSIKYLSYKKNKFNSNEKEEKENVYTDSDDNYEELKHSNSSKVEGFENEPLPY